MTQQIKNFVRPTHEEIQGYAFHLWDAEGRQPGRDWDYWLQAESHLVANQKYEAGLLRPQEVASPWNHPANTPIHPQVLPDLQNRNEQGNPRL